MPTPQAGWTKWLRWATTAGPLANPLAALKRLADRAARLVIHVVALAVTIDAGLRLAIGSHDLVGIAGLLLFACSAAAVGIFVKARESRLSLRAHLDEVALGVAGLVLGFFALSAAAARL